MNPQDWIYTPKTIIMFRSVGKIGKAARKMAYMNDKHN